MPILPRALGQQPQAPQQPPLQAPQPTFADPYEQQRAMLQSRMDAVGDGSIYTPEQAADRRQQNDFLYQMGLLGSLSGNEQLQGTGGVVLKQALASREPKVTEHGTYDPESGKWTSSPDYKRDRIQTQLDRVDAGSAAARERFDAGERDRQYRDYAREDSQAATRENLRITRAAADATRDTANAQHLWTVEDRMGDDFRKETSKDQQVIASHAAMKAVATRVDAPSDIALIYQFMHALDPTSTVREGEFASAQNAAGVPGKIQNMYNSALHGTRLNPQQRTEMLGIADRLASQSQQNIAQAATRYTATALRRPGLNIDSITGGQGAPAATGGRAGDAAADPLGLRPAQRKGP